MMFLLSLHLFSLVSSEIVITRPIKYAPYHEIPIIPGLENGILNAFASSEDTFESTLKFLKMTAQTSWCADKQDPQPWVTLGATDPITFYGMAFRGGRARNSWVSTVRIESTLNGFEWSDIGIFDISVDSEDPAYVDFGRRIVALALRIKVLDFEDEVCMQLEAFVSLLQRLCMYQYINNDDEIPAVASGTGRLSSKMKYNLDEVHHVHRIQLDGTVCTDKPCAWTSKQANAYMEIGTGRAVFWTRVVSQGRSDYEQWTKRFNISYTLDGIDWISLRDFDANTDQTTHVVNILNIKALKLRLTILDFYPKYYASIRAEFYYQFRNSLCDGFDFDKLEYSSQ